MATTTRQTINHHRERGDADEVVVAADVVGRRVVATQTERAQMSDVRLPRSLGALEGVFADLAAVGDVVPLAEDPAAALAGRRPLPVTEEAPELLRGRAEGHAGGYTHLAPARAGVGTTNGGGGIGCRPGMARRGAIRATGRG